MNVVSSRSTVIAMASHRCPVLWLLSPLAPSSTSTRPSTTTPFGSRVPSPVGNQVGFTGAQGPLLLFHAPITYITFFL
uniref:Uncharacterized protein n=1 Tax=Zea mays TaxID=4577 RepID=A0A804PAZ2_MAIZE